MPYYVFVWTDLRLKKLAANGVDPDDFQRIVMNPQSQSSSRSSGRPVAMQVVTKSFVFTKSITMASRFFLLPRLAQGNSMLPFKLTQSQKRQIEKAKAAGHKRVALKLSVSQRAIDENFVADIEDLVRAELRQDLSPSAIARQLREAREAAGMSLADVANITGMTRQAVLAIESGKNANPKIETIGRIAEAFGLALRMELVTRK